MKQPTAYC